MKQQALRVETFEWPGKRVCKRQPGETSDDYPAVATSDRWRVVRCRDNIQWLVQNKQPGSAKWPWHGLAYVVVEKLLPGVLERPSMGIQPDHVDALLVAWCAR